jgi:hypothetical protein
MPTTRDLAQELLAAAPEHEGWSVVEALTDRYEDLLQWVRELDPVDWVVDLKVRNPQLGLVLLWLETEVTRRRGGEGTLWPVLCNREWLPWHPWIFTQLFTEGGHASALHRQLLERAARTYHLRHTFDDLGQNWYRLIYLQFGFTHADAGQRLAAWLSGQVLPISVQRLLAASDSGAQAFQHLWRSLRMFRLGNLSPATLEARLKANPWVLPEWCPDLISAAKKSSAQVLEVADLDAAEIRFFTVPQLAWAETGQPAFTISLCNLDQLALESTDYHLKAGNMTLARLTKQPDGSYFSDAGETITLPVRPTVALSLVSNDGQIAAHDVATLWDSMEDVSLYSLRTGKAIPPGEKLRPGSGVLLIASEDLAIHPTPAESADLELGYRVHRLNPGWIGQLEALLDEDVIWSSVTEEQQGAAPVGVSAWFTETLDLREERRFNAPAPWALPIRFWIPEGWHFVRLRWRRADHHMVELNRIPPVLTLTESDAVKPLTLRVQIASGERTRTEVLRIAVPFVAAMTWTSEDRPFLHQPRQKLLLREARTQAWSFNLPMQNGEPLDPRRCSLLEGHTLHGRLRARPSILPDLGGYGAELRIVEDAYSNAPPVMEVSPCVLDGGVLGAVKWIPEENGFLIKCRLTDLGEDHRFLIWQSNPGEASEVKELNRDNLQPREDGFLWVPGNSRGLHAVALTFRGVRLGSWFNPSSWSLTVVNDAPGHANEIAALLRLWKAPILQREGGHRGRMIDWLGSHWAEILPVWLAPGTKQTPGPDGTEWMMPAFDRHWQTALNELLTSVLPVPDADLAGEIVDALAPGMKGLEALGTAFWRLAEGCPILAARVALAYMDEFTTAPQQQRFLTLFRAHPDLEISDDRSEDLGKILGERDSYWLRQTVPSLADILERGASAIPYAYRLLVKNEAYRLYALGRWIRETPFLEKGLP